MRYYAKSKWDKPPRKGEFQPPRPGKRYQYKPPVRQRADLRGKKIQPYQIQQHVFKDRLHTAQLLRNLQISELLGEAGTIRLTGMSDREVKRVLFGPRRKIPHAV